MFDVNDEIHSRENVVTLSSDRNIVEQLNFWEEFPGISYQRQWKTKFSQISSQVL